MDLLELFGTEPISGIPILDAAFDRDDRTFTANRHHPSKNTMSLALYDQILTVSQQGLHRVYETMTQSEQNVLKQGLRELMLTGILKLESQARSGSSLDLLQSSSSGFYSVSDVKQWVTLSDFLKIFPTTLTFTYSHNGFTHTSHLLEAWEAFFGGLGGFGGFDQKLFEINRKIQKFKDELKAGNNPYTGWLESFYPIAGERFLEDAEIFASQLWRLMDNSMFSGLFDEKDLVNRWHIYLMKKSFEI